MSAPSAVPAPGVAPEIVTLPAPIAPDGAATSAPPLVILNPAGNGGRTARLHGPIQRLLGNGRGELVRTTAPRVAERLARAAAEAGRAVVVVGGDGTIAEAVNGILAAGVHVPLGIVPAGNGNDYAYRALNLPHDIPTALEVALTGRLHAVDVGSVNGRYFANALGVGLDANVAAAAEHLKRIPFLRGQALYWTSSLGQLLFRYHRCPYLTITLDGIAQPERLIALAAVSLGPTYGGGFRINPNARVDDGLFDVCVAVKPSQLRAFQLLPMIERGEHLNEPEISHAHATRVIFEARHNVHSHLDGEVISGRRFEVVLHPGALLVRLP